MINKSTMPRHWRTKNLKSISESIQYGYTESSSKEKNGPKFLRITDIQDSTVIWDNVPYCKIDDKIKHKYLLRNGDLVFARTGATVGKSFLIKGEIPEAVFASYLIRVRVNQEINEKFLHYFFNSPNYWGQITEEQVGIGQPNVNGTKLGKLDIPIPSIPEQISIVSKIEELFSELDKGKQQLETVKQQLKTYRKSLLNTIIKDKQNHLISSIIEKLDQGWSPRCLNEKSNDDGEWAVIKTTAVQSGRFVSEENKILPLELNPREQHELHLGDILITRAGPRIRVGVCCMVRKIRPKLINCDKVYRIRVNNAIVMPEYFEMVLNTAYYQYEIEKMKTGISDSGVNLTQIQFLKLSIPVPDLDEQRQIVSEIESRLSVCDKMEEIIETSLKQAESLRQSILKQAFEGKLVTYRFMSLPAPEERHINRTKMGK